ncbi:ABC-type polysaccharide/polyol phosphate export permease [Loktanella sp. DSM 29012]|uniref:ABC transporter permease n=1 Tax=Loktanella gaetbuli TaxID=2881335 RepID=A0ABS8BU77_9RHOB|nr:MULTISPECIES: ABC transporter permease [Loktanella]MCB5199262.1 ABC transporter permease [Loktanella gaetbuli]SEP59232.1 ABC-type polysaccharide/polyol phosphate export permease [Loktanella sp. DSM 29012]
MFQPDLRRTRTRTVFGMMELIYHSAVRDIRKSHRNALMGLVLNIFQTVLFVLSFYAMFMLLGMRGAAVRGDFLLYIMSGIFLYMSHTKAMNAIVQSEGPASAMMQHAPMNTVIAICASALSALYLQILSILVVLFFYHVLFTPVYIDQPIGALGMVILAWFSGCAVGTIFLAIKPWMPEFAKIGSSIYGRVNMIASGKMFLANALPASMLVMFDWNPLFHCIDQMRGFVFENYHPYNSNVSYPVKVAIVLLVLGLLGEFYTRRQASASWNAAR